MDIKKSLIIQTRWGTRIIPAGKWFIDRSTPIGKDADIYEHKPYGGKRLIPRLLILGQLPKKGDSQ